MGAVMLRPEALNALSLAAGRWLDAAKLPLKAGCEAMMRPQVERTMRINPYASSAHRTHSTIDEVLSLAMPAARQRFGAFDPERGKICIFYTVPRGALWSRPMRSYTVWRDLHRTNRTFVAGLR